MADCVYILAHKYDPEETYDPSTAYDEAKSILLSGDELHLGCEGYIYNVGEAGDPDFFDGATHPDEIRKAARDWKEPYISELVNHIRNFLRQTEIETHIRNFLQTTNPQQDDPDIANQLKQAILTYDNNYAFYKTVNQLFGYPDFGVSQLFIDDNGCASVNPTPTALEDVDKHPEKYYVLYVTYHG